MSDHFDIPISPAEAERQRKLRDDAAAWAKAEREKEQAEREKAERERLAAEDAALQLQLKPGWLLANPTATEDDFKRLWPHIKARHETDLQESARQVSLQRKRADSVYDL